MRYLLVWVTTLSLTAAAANAAELSFHFSGYTLGQVPQGFRSTVVGDGKPADWKVVEDELPSALQRITAQAPVTTKQRVVGQFSQDPTDEHFPILYFTGDTFGDFTITTHIKLVKGVVEQMAGVVFRMQDEKNFYVIRASGLGNNIRFYKVVAGTRSTPIGTDIELTNNAWYTLKIDCTGNQIRCWLNEREAFPALTDNSFNFGKLGFFTKSDSVSYFGDTDLTYVPREPHAQKIIREVMKEQPRLLGISIYMPDPASGALKVIASNDDKALGTAGTDIEGKTLKTDAIFQARGDGNVTVVLPIHDRNGDTMAVAHLLMESFPGQTEQNVLARAVPLIKMIQLRAGTAKDLND